MQQRIVHIQNTTQACNANVQIVAVSKQQDIKKIQQAYKYGLHHFGESYLQDALPKITALEHLQLNWHMIGQIQSNKTAKIAAHFDWVHSVNSIKIATRLAKQRPTHMPALKILLQITPSELANDYAISPNELHDIIAIITKLPNLNWQGLMAKPPLGLTPTQLNQYYQAIANIYQKLQLIYPITTLSMGMSNDYQIALAHGANMLRLGNAIFQP